MLLYNSSRRGSSARGGRLGANAMLEIPNLRNAAHSAHCVIRSARTGIGYKGNVYLELDFLISFHFISFCFVLSF